VSFVGALDVLNTRIALAALLPLFVLRPLTPCER
jgi:hypothetical protein